MNRLRDYIGFVIRFAGLGYLVLWPLASSGPGGKLFGATILCRAPGPLDVICQAPHPLLLSPALHAMGLLALATVAGQFIWRLIRRTWHKEAASRRLAPAPRLDSVLRKPAARLRQRPVKPRDHFGLRGQQPAIGNR